MRKTLVSFLALLTALVGCGHATERFQDDLQAHRCDQALSHIPGRDPMIKFSDNSKLAAGKIASYSFVGASYTAEVLWDVTGGILMFVGLCGPSLAAMSFAGGNAAVAPPVTCLPGKMNALSSPPLGRRALENTKDMRCPDIVSLSNALRDVSSCYEAEGGATNFKKAVDNLENLRSSTEFYSCLPDDEKNLVAKQIDRLKTISPQ